LKKHKHPLSLPLLQLLLLLSSQAQ
jgi:hypothetical protein